MRARLVLLGNFALEVDGRPVAMHRAPARTLAALALRKRPVSRPALAEVLWPMRSPDRARANLRSVIWRLPPVARPVIVVDRADHLSLAGEVEVDVDLLVERCRGLLRSADRPGGDGQRPAPGFAHDDLVADLLPMWDDEWVLVDRARLRQLRLHALDALATTLVACGRVGEAVDAASAALRDEPLRESSAVALAAAHLADGNVVDARRVVDAFRGNLARELGIEPSSRLTDLVRDPRDGRVPGDRRTTTR